jgi:hypothetical protein
MNETPQESWHDPGGRVAHTLGILTAPFLKFSFAHSTDLLAVLAVAAGVLLLLQR